jgi:hypothetical protein
MLRSEVAGEERRDTDRKIAREFVETDSRPGEFGPMRSPFKVTVIDQASP